MKAVLFSCFLLITCFSRLAAQYFPNPSFTQLDAEELGVTKAFYQAWDSKGKLWAVTDKGLLVYDGYKSRIIEHRPGVENLPLSRKVRSLWKTGPDEFWITYADSLSISRFNAQTGEVNHYHTDSANADMLPPFEVAKILPHTDSTIWVLTWGGGLCKMNYNGHVTRYSQHVPEGSDVTSPGFVKDMFPLISDAAGRTSGAVNEYLVGFFDERRTAPQIFNVQAGTFRPFELSEYLAPLDRDILSAVNTGLSIVNFVHVHENGQLWFGTYIGLFRLDPEKKTIERVATFASGVNEQNHFNARSYVIDRDGFMWVATQNQGVMIVNLETAEARFVAHEVAISSSLADDRILTLNTDPDGNIWVSTEAGIFSICQGRAQLLQIYPWKEMSLDFTYRSFQTIPVNQLSVLPDGHLYISNKTGIVEYDPAMRKVIRTIDPSTLRSVPSNTQSRVEHFRKVGNKVHFIVKTPKGSEELGGIIDLEKNSCQVLESETRPHNVLFRHAGPHAPVVYYTTYKEDALFSYDGSNKLSVLTTFPDSIKLRETFSMILASGKWMIATDPGFVLFNPLTKETEHYTHRSDRFFFPDSIVTCAFADTGGQVWVGTKNGLYLFNETTGLTEKQNALLGLPDQETVNAFTRDKQGIYWIALTKDLLRWDRDKKEIFRFDRSHGLLAGSFLPAVAQQDSAGNIYIATYNGVLIFDPARLEIPVNNLSLFLSGADLSGIPLNATELLSGKATFSHDKNFLTFEFYTNQISALTPHHFYYRLKGRDETWQDNGILNRIRLADLAHGDYIMEVKAVNSFAHESNVVEISFVIEKPFWLRWWFFALTGAVIIILVFYYVQYRERTLRKRSIELERTVTERTADVVREKKEVEKQRQVAEHQKEIVEEKQKEITDSINYAKRIQDAYLPEQGAIGNLFDEAFILFRPKDIVSGDFYWFYSRKDHQPDSDDVFIAVADCTGHGVPGAIMSVICCSALNEAIINKGISEPALILDEVREIIIKNLKSSTSSQQKDGMDVALCRFNKKTNELQYAGAHNPLWIFRKGAIEMEELKADKQPVGMFDMSKPFSNHITRLYPGDMFFMFSDGFSDQFGGPKGKKFKSSSLRQFLFNHALLPVDEQKNRLVLTFDSWKGDLEQLDDVCVAGVRVRG